MSNPQLGPEESTSFLMQQLNLMFRAQFDPKFSAFLNIEAIQNFSSDKKWGSMRIEEAWLRYRHTNALNFKFGLLIPTYNYLNKIKNRSPLIPYLIRPIVYETRLENLYSPDEYVPRQGFFEVYGVLSVSSDLEVSYSAFLGNSQGATTDIPIGSYVTGEDTTKAFLVGGRISFKHKSVELGISATKDVSNQTEYVLFGFPTPGVGVIDRYRIGLDLSRTYKTFFFEGEISRILYEKSAEIDERLSAIRDGTPFIGEGLNRLFYFFTVGYNINDHLFVYALYSLYQWDASPFVSEGAPFYSLGLGFQPISQVSFKLQAMESFTLGDSFISYEFQSIGFGCSILF